MSMEIVKALLVLSRYCLNHENCKTCVLREFCGKQPCNWAD
jgi:hypothetical protein